MKAVIAATVLAMVHSTCDSDSSCGEELTCAVQLPHPQDLSCEFPDFNTPCCDMFGLNVGCQTDRRGINDCLEAGLRALPSAEQTFFHSSGGIRACSGMQNMQEQMQQYCTPAAGTDMKATTLTLVGKTMETQFAMMDSQEPKSDIQQSSLVPGMVGCAVGAAVATSVLTLKKKRASGEMYSPLTEVTA